MRRSVTANLSDVISRGPGSTRDARMPIGTYKSAPLDPRVIAALPPGPERDAAIDALMEPSADRVSRLGALSEELHELVALHNPVRLIPPIAALAGMGLIGPGVEDDAPQTFDLNAKLEYLAGLAVAGPAGSANVGPQVVQDVLSLVSAVFDATRAQLVIDATAERSTERPGVDQTSVLFRLEHLTNRMSGYAVHLEEIADEVFEPHRDLYCEELGFCPSDAVRLVRRHTAWVREQYGTRDQLEEVPTAGQPGHHGAVEMHFLLDAVEAGHIWSPSRLAESTRLPFDQVAALLRSMSTEFGCQPRFRRPFFDSNKLFSYPLVRLPDGLYLAPDPWAVAHRIHDWIQDYIGNKPGSSLLTKYRDHRSQAAERLVRRGLERVFGESAVFGNQFYDSCEASGEIDAIVVGSTPVLCEVKSHRLPDRVRIGDRPRTERIADEVVTKSFKQTRRARTYILEEGGRQFAERQGAQPVELLRGAVTDVILIAVTLERLDPLAMAAGELAVGHQPYRIWVTNLADLLMVRDVLDDPASFLHYARTRGMAFERGIQIYVESDALGEYLASRLVS